MYRVMIVDDEEPVLESFSYILGKGVPGFELCGTARSGTSAIELVPKAKPNLIFMDIQMPGIDGIEAIKIIRKQDPSIIFILASAYERFDIARKAIPLGVFNYLVKPVTRKALTEEFAKVKAQLDEMSEKSDLRLKEADYAQRMRDEEKRRFLLGLAWASPGEREWGEFARLFSVKGDLAAVMLLKIANPLPKAEIEEAYRSMIQRIQYKSSCLTAVLSGQMILLFHEAEDPEEMEGLVVRASEGVGRLDCRFGLGGFRHYSALSESYREAFEQLRSLEGKTSSISRQRQEARDLRDAFLYSDWDEVQSSYEKYWTEVFMSNDFLVAKARMVEFFACLMGELEKDRKIPRGIDLDPAEEIIELSSVQKWQQWSSCVMDRLRFIIKERKDQFYPKPLSLAMNYILENYAKPLHLAAVAEQCEISQGYLSRLFSEYLNTSFIDYLNNLRINEAVRLLRNEKKPVKEVSHLVGYGDPNYFSRIFKRNLKVSPSDFAKGGSNNEE